MSKDILIRGAPSPLDRVSPREAWETNAYHNNSGNVAFPYGLIRNLTTDEVAVHSDWYGVKLPPPEEVNERFGMYILPMANDFGSHFAKEMAGMTKYIKQLRIPVVVVGIGGAFSATPDFSGVRSYDRVVKEFLSAVLDRSATIGLRGTITADYLLALGYKEGSHFRVIGDPTLYNRGSNLRIREFVYRPGMRVAYNMTPKAPQNALEFLNKLPETHESAIYVPQDIGELAKVYSGAMDVTANTLRDKINNFPNRLTHQPYASGNIRFFLNAPTWFKFMAEMDLSVGTRIHGNIIPTHEGTPSLTMMYGSRLTELAEFHGLPRVRAQDVDPDGSLESLVSDVDFHEPERVHPRNFENYLDFLDENQIQNLYRLNDSGVQLPFDRKLEVAKLEEPITPITSLNDPEEILRRVIDGYEVTQKKVIAQRDRIAKMRAQIAELKKSSPKASSDRKGETQYQARLTDLERRVAALERESRVAS